VIKNTSLEERLKAHPHLKQRIEKLLEIVEEVSGDLDWIYAAKI